jgi:hypothetical protein
MLTDSATPKNSSVACRTTRIQKVFLDEPTMVEIQLMEESKPGILDLVLRLHFSILPSRPFPKFALGRLLFHYPQMVIPLLLPHFFQSLGLITQRRHDSYCKLTNLWSARKVTILKSLTERERI